MAKLLTDFNRVVDTNVMCVCVCVCVCAACVMLSTCFINGYISFKMLF